jgi:predicted patatin/cPLA2 family phospholipase
MYDAPGIPRDTGSRNEVADVLLRRRLQSSRPGHRQDGRMVALAVEGGGMYGVVAGGMVTALEELGLLNSFDSIYGSSAGAIAAAYFIAGQARYGTTIFYENINNRDFIDLRRMLRGAPGISLSFLLDHVCILEKPLLMERLLAAQVKLNVLATSVARCASVAFDSFDNAADLFQALRCGASIPFASGPPVSYRGDNFLDASLCEPIPFRTAINHGATDVVVLLTRPEGSGPRRIGSWLEGLLTERYLAKRSACLAAIYRDRHAAYARDLADLDAGYGRDGPPRILPVRTERGSRAISPLEKDRNILVEGAAAGFRAVHRALGLPVPATTFTHLTCESVHSPIP